MLQSDHTAHPPTCSFSVNTRSVQEQQQQACTWEKLTHSPDQRMSYPRRALHWHCSEPAGKTHQYPLAVETTIAYDVRQRDRLASMSQLTSTFIQKLESCCMDVHIFLQATEGAETGMLTPPAHVTPDEAPLVGAGDGGRLPGRPCMPRRIHGQMESVRFLATCTSHLRPHTKKSVTSATADMHFTVTGQVLGAGKVPTATGLLPQAGSMST